MKLKKLLLPLIVFLVCSLGVTITTVIKYNSNDALDRTNYNFTRNQYLGIFAVLNAAQRPDGRRTLYFAQGYIGGQELIDVNALDINATGNPNNYDLMNGDTCIVATTSLYFDVYVFDADGTDAESTSYPYSVIRPEDYSTEGVWRLVTAQYGDSSSFVTVTIDGVIYCSSDDCSTAANGTTCNVCFDETHGEFWYYDGASAVQLLDSGTDYEEETHASEHNEGGADEVDRFTTGITWRDFGDTNTPDVTNGGTAVTHFWVVNDNSHTYADFVDDTSGGDHSEFVAGDWFFLKVDNANAVIDFSTKTYIIRQGGAALDFTGSDSATVYLLFEYDGSIWREILLPPGISAPNSLQLGSISATVPYVFSATPTTDDTWQGSTSSVTAGESISQWDIIYLKYDTDGPRAFMYNANSTDSDNDTYRPFGIALEAGTAGNALSIGVGLGLARNDGWTFSDATDEGKPIFAGETDGVITLTRPSDSGDHIVHLGNLLDEDEIMFYFGPITDVVVP